MDIQGKVGDLAQAVSLQNGTREASSEEGKVRRYIFGAYHLFSIGVLCYAALNQIKVHYDEISRNERARDQIESMKQEQGLLVEKGWANPRHIGFIQKAEEDAENNSAKLTQRYSFWGMNSGWMIKAYQKMGRGLVGPRAWNQPELVISPFGMEVRKEDKADNVVMLRKTTEAIYRHEEAHALAFENDQLKVSLLKKESFESSITANVLIDLQRKALVSSDSEVLEPTMDWRIKWLMELQEEAFADAFSAITASIKGEEGFKDHVLTYHMLRMIGDKDRDIEIITSIDRIGLTHSVDMANFMAGQLPANKLTHLNREQVLELSNHIAAASVRWAIARQAPFNGFFSQKGQEWFLEGAKELGIDSQKAQKEWDAWKKEAQSDHPRAVFEDKHWTVAGRVWSVRGLPKMKTQSQWRLDGLFGLEERFVYGERDLEASRYKEWDRDDEYPEEDSQKYKPNLQKEKEKAQRDKVKQEHRIAAAKGPLWTQWVLASYLGRDPLKEVERFERAKGPMKSEKALNYSSELIQSFEAEALRQNVKLQPVALMSRLETKGDGVNVGISGQDKALISFGQIALQHVPPAQFANGLSLIQDSTSAVPKWSGAINEAWRGSQKPDRDALGGLFAGELAAYTKASAPQATVPTQVDFFGSAVSLKAKP